MNNTSKRRETSKVLLWTIIASALAISVTCLVLCAWLAVEQLGIAITVVGGMWAAAVPVEIGCYSDKAKEENIIKLSQSAEIDCLRAELEALRAELAPKPKAARKPQKATDNDALVGQIRLLLEQAGSLEAE